MPKPYPHGITPDGRDYACEQCGSKIPDGVFVRGHWTGNNKLTGVSVATPDGVVVHECGTVPKTGEGAHGG